MLRRIAPYGLAAAVLVAAFAAFRSQPSSAPSESELHSAPVSSDGPDMANERAAAPTLPPNHPPIGSAASAVEPVSEPAALAWKVPDGWTVAASPSAMRLATYRVPHAKGDTDDAEMSVARAGGSTEANIQRWLGQFDDAGQEKREVKTVRGSKVTIVEVSGTFLGGGMGGVAAAPRPHWTLLAAIVEGSGSPYFFKMTGPAATVRGSRAAFDGLVDSLHPSS